jgi:flagellar hook-associated protein 3 FlgL
MRVSNQMMADNIKLNLARLSTQLVKSEEQISTGKRINRASDDPIGMERVLNYRQRLSQMDQYTTNISSAKQHIDTVDTILEGVTSLINDAKGFAADSDPDQRQTYADQVGMIRDQIIQMANSKSNGQYLFGGDVSDSPPFDSTTGAYSGDHGTKDFLIGDGQQFNITVDGSEIFQGSNTDDVFTVLESLQTELAKGDAADSDVISSHMSQLQDAIDQITAVRSENAGRYQRLEASENHYASFSLNIEDLLSSTEDVDMASAIIDYQNQQTAYESSLSVSSQIIQKSLVDFLR